MISACASSMPSHRGSLTRRSGDVLGDGQFAVGTAEAATRRRIVQRDVVEHAMDPDAAQALDEGGTLLQPGSSR